MLRASLLSLLLAFVLALNLPSANGQQPTPEPAPEWIRCMEGAGGQEGARTIAVDFNIGTLVDVPPGHTQLLLMPPGWPSFALCHVETGAVMVISRTTCAEVSRRTASPEGDAVVDQIVASCIVPQERPPEPRCDSGQYVFGDQRFTILPAGITITLPQGDFILGSGHRGPNTVLICKVQDNLVSLDYSVIIATHDCSRMDAAWVNPAGAALTDQILTSCTPAAGAGTPVPPARSTIRPPDTGSGGLK